MDTQCGDGVHRTAKKKKKKKKKGGCVWEDDLKSKWANATSMKI